MAAASPATAPRATPKTGEPTAPHHVAESVPVQRIPPLMRAPTACEELSRARVPAARAASARGVDRGGAPAAKGTEGLRRHQQC
jgi:hypothetical protein